jgi:hypothetical protein
MYFERTSGAVRLKNFRLPYQQTGNTKNKRQDFDGLAVRLERSLLK